jgi:hypothetical protein
MTLMCVCVGGCTFVRMRKTYRLPEQGTALTATARMRTSGPTTCRDKMQRESPTQPICSVLCLSSPTSAVVPSFVVE